MKKKTEVEVKEKPVVEVQRGICQNCANWRVETAGSQESVGHCDPKNVTTDAKFTCILWEAIP